MTPEEQEKIVVGWVETYNRKKTGLTIRKKSDNMWYGVFTTKKWKAYSPIAEYSGEKLSKQEFGSKYPLHDAIYVSQCHNNLFIDAVDPRKSSVARFINGADDQNHANAEVVAMTEEECLYMYVMDTDIEKGTEIFWTYGDNFELPSIAAEAEVEAGLAVPVSSEPLPNPYLNPLFNSHPVFELFDGPKAK